MGNDENRRAPFHLNVNGRMLQDDNYYYNYPYERKFINNTSNKSKTPDKIKPISKKKYKESEELTNIQKNEEKHIKDEEEKRYKKLMNKRIKNQKNKSYDDKGKDMTIDIDVISKNKVNIKIPLNKKKIWQKKYNKNEIIGTVTNDYILDNKLNLPDDFFSKLRYHNKPVNLHDKISSLLPEETNENDNLINNENSYLLKNKNKLLKNENSILEKDNIYEGNNFIDLSHLNEKFSEMMGKPFFNPFQIRCFYKMQRKFKVLNYNNELIEKFGLNSFDSTSAYCNGLNHLYISGGEKYINKLLDINLKKNVIYDPVEILPKKYHSMIFIPKTIIFFVGGNNSETFYYNLKLKKLVKWGKLNVIRIEPALQILNKKLYCIDSKNSISNKNNYTIEVTDLSVDKGEWIIMKPKFPDNLSAVFSQRFFGVCNDKNNSILFLGGKFDDEQNTNNNMNFKYNVFNNNIELSQVKFQKFNLKEKTFCPFNNLYDYILTDFQKESPQIAFYNKKKGKIELINFSADDSKHSSVFSFKEKNEINNDTNINKEKNTFNGHSKNDIKKENKSYKSSRNPYLKKNLNNIENLNNIQSTNTNYINNSPPKFEINNPQFVDINQAYNPPLNTFNSNIEGDLAKTTDNYVNQLQNIYDQNSNSPNIYTEQNITTYYLEPKKIYYYPKNGLNNQLLGQNNIYNEYYSTKYNY